MGIFAKYDIEKLLFDVKAKIVSDYNTQLTAVTADKAKDKGAIVLNPVLKPLATEAIDILSINKKTFAAHDPFMIIQLVRKESPENLGENRVELAVMLSLLDPHDYNGEVRMLRYLRALEELFAPLKNKKLGICTLSSTELLPYLSTPDFMDKTKRRLTWGIGLDFEW